MTELELRGGVSFRTHRPMKHPDIILSLVDETIYPKNKFTIKKHQDGSYSLYHMYNSMDDKISGRWYNVHTDLENDLDPEDQIFYRVLPEYERWGDNRTVKNVPAVIQFTPDGWRKLQRFLQN